jgi:hypothetical protein
VLFFLFSENEVMVLTRISSDDAGIVYEVNRALRGKVVNWEVGDVALCVTPGSPMEGKEVTILSPAFPRPEKSDLVHIVDPGFPPSDYFDWGAERRHLRPLPDPNEPGSWDNCVFEPRELVS